MHPFFKFFTQILRTLYKMGAKMAKFLLKGPLKSVRIKWKNFLSVAILSSVIWITVRLHLLSYDIQGTLEFAAKIDDSAIKKYYYQADNKQSNQKTEGCSIPVTPAIPAFLRSNWKRTVQDCSYEKKLAVLENETNLRFLPEVPSPCCIQEIIRGKNDREWRLTDCEYSDGDVKIGMKEALLVSCGDFINAEASIPIKPEVQEKIDYWESFPLEERPPSVFIFGVDSTSRAHAYRSLPQSIESMMKLGFVDFRSYHSIRDLTLPNFMAFLMGLTVPEAQGSCAPNWSTPFDTCPFIWKKFSERKYVTSFMEDGRQTFNFGDESGFNQKPTDYYLHHLFLELQRVRSGLLPYFGKQQCCMSTETVPEFLLRYSLRFLQKFVQIPFFSFTWLTYPFHDDMYALPSLDEDLVKMLEGMSLNEHLLRNTLLIFIGDHGDKVSLFSQEAHESWVERGLPPLFIRLPDRFKSEHPEALKTLLSNSGKFTTPFDIHQTLLHFLNMSSSPESGRDNYADRADRSSLFKDLLSNRTCASTNIPQYTCLCKTNNEKFFQNNDTKVHNGFTSQVLLSAVQLLNTKIQNSKYRDKCFEWDTSGFQHVGFHRIVSRSTESVDSVITFRATPGQAKFEVRVNTTLGMNGNGNGSTRLISFSRRDLYGDQSWCVGDDTAEDKIMKELCYCI